MSEQGPNLDHDAALGLRFELGMAPGVRFGVDAALGPAFWVGP